MTDLENEIAIAARSVGATVLPILGPLPSLLVGYKGRNHVVLVTRRPLTADRARIVREFSGHICIVPGVEQMLSMLKAAP